MSARAKYVSTTYRLLLAHPHSYPIDNRGLLYGGKTLGAWNWAIPFLY
jgi:hypothetical protein